MTQPAPITFQTLDYFDKLIERGDNLDLVMGQIPSMFGSSEKATYLGFRAVGLSHKDALEMLKRDETDYAIWLAQTPQLAEFVNGKLLEMQDKIGLRITRLSFLRNLTYYMILDSHEVQYANKNGIDAMSEGRQQYLKTARRNYTPKNLLDMEKALDPEKHQQAINITIDSGRGYYEIVDAEEGSVKELPSGG